MTSVIAPYYCDEHAGITVYRADCRSILPELDAVDHVITDPPYNEHTHSKQRRGAASGKGHQFGFGNGGSSGISMERHLGFGFITSAEMEDIGAELARVLRRWGLVFARWSSRPIGSRHSLGTD